MLSNKNLFKIGFTFTSLIFLLSGFCGVSEAHILVIGDSHSDYPDFYNEALQLSTDLKSRGYPVVELYRENATSENILKGMYNADCVIYVGHGGYQYGNYDEKGGTASPPFALVGSDNFIWGMGDQMLEDGNSNLFKAPFKQNIPVFLLHACFSMGWVESYQVANPIETTYNFAHMFTGASANYYATAWDGAEIIYDFLNGAANFQVANNQNYEKIVTSTIYNSTMVWRNNGGYAAFIGNWNGTFPTVSQTTLYNDTAAEAWYNSDRQIHQLTCNFSTNPSTPYSGQPLNFVDNSTSVGGNIITYFWDFGDGNTSTAINPTHLFSTPGNYLIKHTVTDDHGLIAQANQTLSILGNNSIIYVNQLMGNDTWDGTSPTWTSGTIGPVKTIQNAINLVTSGGTVKVASGNYSENLVINRQVNLTAANNTEIRALSPDKTTIVVNKNASGSNLQGFQVTGAESASGVYLNDSDNCTLQNNNITGNNIGVLDTGDSNNINSNNIEDNSWSGVCLSESDNNLIENNNIENNSEGIYLTGNSTNNTIKNNRITQNTYNGVNIRNSNNNQIKGNQIIQNGNNPTFSQGNGAILYQSLQNIFENNTIEYNGWAGVVLDSSCENNLQGSNTIRFNDNGLVLYGASSQNNINGNNISQNDFNGVQLFSNCADNHINKNTIDNNQVTGLLVQQSNNNTVNSNNITQNQYNGMALDESDFNTFTDNIILNSGSIGMVMVGSDSNTIKDNLLTGNYWTNMVLDQSHNNLIQDNTINGTNISQNGIWFQKSCNQNNITSNIITGNTANGLFIRDSQNNSINYNNITFNGQSGSGIGLLLSNTNSTIINSNTFQENAWAGSCIIEGNNNIITQNNYISNPVQAYDNSNNQYDNGTTGNYWNDSTTTPRTITGGPSTDSYPATYPF